MQERSTASSGFPVLPVMPSISLVSVLLGATAWIMAEEPNLLSAVALCVLSRN